MVGTIGVLVPQMSEMFDSSDSLRQMIESIGGTGATSVLGDLVNDPVEELAERMHGHDAVVFSAGAHGTGRDQTTLIDGAGLEKAAAAAAQAGVPRFVLVSAFPESERGRDLGEGFEHYMRVKKAADVHLVHTELDWVIVRPGGLLDSSGTGHVSAGPAIAYGSIPRDDVAGVIAEILHTPAVSREIVELTSGATPIAEAVASLARARQNTNGGSGTPSPDHESNE